MQNTRWTFRVSLIVGKTLSRGLTFHNQSLIIGEKLSLPTRVYLMSSFLISFYIHNKTRKIKTLNKVSVVRDDNLIYSHEFHLIKKKTHFTRSFRLNTQILLMLLHLFLVFLVLIYFLIRPKYQMLSKSYYTLTMYVLLKMYGSKNFTFLLLC